MTHRYYSEQLVSRAPGLVGEEAISEKTSPFGALIMTSHRGQATKARSISGSGISIRFRV